MAQTGGCNIYIAGLPKSADDDWLLKEFRVFGPIISSKVMKKGGSENSYGFVQYHHVDAAARAVERMDGFHTAEIYLSVKFADRDKENTALLQSAQLEVSNLPLSTSLEEVYKVFQKFGPIVGTSMLSSDPKPVALVEFARIDDAIKAKLEMHGLLVGNNGKPLVVKYFGTMVERQKRRGRRTRPPTTQASRTMDADNARSDRPDTATVVPSSVASPAPAEPRPGDDLFLMTNSPLLACRAGFDNYMAPWSRFDPGALRNHFASIIRGEDAPYSPTSSIGEVSYERNDFSTGAGTAGEYTLFDGFSVARHRTHANPASAASTWAVGA